MMNYIAKLKNNVLAKMIVSYSIVTVFLIGIIAAFVFAGTSESMIQEISVQSQYRLERVMHYTEETLLNKYEESFRNHIFPSIGSKQEEEWVYFLTGMKQGNENRIIQLVHNLAQIKFTYSEAENITLYFLRDNFLVDNSYFYDSPDSYKDSSFIRTIAAVEPNRWFQRTNGTGSKLLSYVFTLPYHATGDEIKGYLILDLKIDSIRSLYLDMMHAGDENIYVFDKEDRLLLSTSGTIESDLDAIVRLKRESGGNHFLLDKGKMGRKVVSLQPSDASRLGWTYAIVRPMDAFFLSSGKLRNQIIWICAVVLAIGISLSYFLSRRFYLPLKSLLFNIRNVYGMPKPLHDSNEYKLIDRALHHLDRKVVSLQNELKTRQLLQVINGNPTDLQGELQLPLECRYVAVRIELIQGSAEIFCKQFGPLKGSLLFEILPLQEQEIALLYFPARTDEDACELIRLELETLLQVPNPALAFRCAIGHAVHSLEGISESYRNAREAFRYFFLYDDRSIVTHGDIADRKGLANMMSFIPFENALRAGDSNAADSFLERFELALRGSVMNMEAIQLSLIQLVSTMAQTIVEMNLNDKIVSVAGIFSDYKQTTLTGTLAWVRSICQELSLYLNVQSKNAHEALILELKDYIDRHFHEDISLQTLSEKGGLTASYISTLFGEVMNVSFTEYLSALRLKKAADLLRSSSMPVKEITHLAGYRNVQYFCAKFKEYYGVTPIQYRNAIGGDPLMGTADPTAGK